MAPVPEAQIRAFVDNAPRMLAYMTAHSEVRLELEAEDAKAVELSLINAGVPYAAVTAPGRETQLRLESQATVRLVILSPQQRRNRPRRDRTAAAEERLTVDQLRLLLGTEKGR